MEVKVKGTALKTTRDFVKSKFPQQYSQWLNALSSESKAIYESVLDASGWYPLKEAYLLPARKIIEMFYNNDFKKGGEDLGIFSAELALKGFYKVFLLIASPNFLMQRGSKIFSTFYSPTEIKAEMINSNSGIVKIIQFEGIDSTLEYRIAGWIRKALELANCKDPNYQIRKAISKGDNITEIIYTWK
jgi:hypothetical protein